MKQPSNTSHKSETSLVPEKLLTLALNNGLPLAIWRLPNQATVTAIIDLHSNQDFYSESLEDVPAGFLINPFHHHHPTKPYLIHADCKIEWSIGDSSSIRLTTDPSISDSQLDVLFGKEEAAVIQPQSTSQTHDPTGSTFQHLVDEAIQKIHEGHFSKVVLSRFKDVSIPEGFDIIDFFEKACQTYENAFCYVTHTERYGLWMGATPETLLSVDDKGMFATDALAGTQRLDDRDVQEVAWTQKEIEEQAMVSRYIIDCFKKIRLREFDENGPRTIKAGNLAHLKTSYTVDTAAISMPELPTTMMHLLHPTSAVCGMPLSSALEFIEQKEHYDRELYAGFLGPVNIHRESRLFVNLRCMKVMNKSTARLYAGAGITEDSNPEKEFIETEMKMNTLQRLINN